MSAWLFFIFILALVVVVIGYNYSRKMESYSDNVLIDLSTNENKLLDDWYKDELSRDSKTFDEIEQFKLAQLLLEKHFNIKEDENNLIISNDISSKYPTLKTYKLRDVIGRNVEISIIKNQKIRERLLSEFSFDDEKLSDVYRLSLDDLAKDFLTKVLNKRWDSIKNLENENVINDSGSYLYLKNDENLNVKTKPEKRKFRVNLLCPEREFRALISRLKIENSSLLKLN